MSDAQGLGAALIPGTTVVGMGTAPDRVRAALLDEVPGLLRYARSLTRDRSTAEDLVQETVLRAMERADSFRGDSSPATWLHRILHNLAVDHARRNREVPVEDVMDVEALWGDDAYTVDAETVALRAQTRADLEDALVHLPVAYRSAVLLHDVEGLTVPQVAQVQEVGLAAAKQRLRRGRMMLVTELARLPERRAAGKGVPLRCWDARSRIGDYLDRVMSPDEAAVLERHLQGCPTCPPLYAALVATTEALAARRTGARAGGRDPDSVVPAALATKLALVLGELPARTPAGADAPPAGGSFRR